MKAQIYTTPTCPYCTMVKELLDKEEIDYVEYDVAYDEVARQRMVKITGQLGVPVTVIDGQKIVGFDSKSLEEAIKKAKAS